MSYIQHCQKRRRADTYWLESIDANFRWQVLYVLPGCPSCGQVVLEYSNADELARRSSPKRIPLKHHDNWLKRLQNYVELYEIGPKKEAKDKVTRSAPIAGAWTLRARGDTANVYYGLLRQIRQSLVLRASFRHRVGVSGLRPEHHKPGGMPPPTQTGGEGEAE